MNIKPPLPLSQFESWKKTIEDYEQAEAEARAFAMKYSHMALPASTDWDRRQRDRILKSKTMSIDYFNIRDNNLFISVSAWSGDEEENVVLIWNAAALSSLMIEF